MAVPQLTQFQPGIGVYTADWANTTLQAGCLIQHLRTFSGVANMTVMTIGGAAANDGLGQVYYWNPTAVAQDNNSSVIVPVGVTVGAWISLGTLLNSSASSSLVVPTTAVGTNALTLTPTTGAAPTSYVNGQTFSFVAPASTTGAVTAAVAALPSIPIYSPSAKSQLGTLSSATQDLIQGATYLITFNSALGGTGGFQVTGGGGHQIIDEPYVSYAPTNNPPTTLSSFLVQAVTSANTTRQFLASFGLTSNAGAGTAGADKVAVYAATLGLAGSSDIWSINCLTTLDSTFTTSSSALGIELDYNNFCQARGAVDGIAGLGAPLAEGLVVTGAGTFGSQSAIAVNGNTQSIWYRGVTVASGVASVSFADYSTATIGIEMQATHAGWGIDMNQSLFSGGGAIRIPNGTGIFARNSTNTADVAIAFVASNNNLIIGASNAAGQQAASNVSGGTWFPITDNAYQLGAANNRWQNVYAVNGTIQTSDPRLKTDIKPLPAVLDLVAKINPITYRFKVGGVDVVEVTEEQEVQDTVTLEYDHFEIVVENGKAIRKPIRKVETREAWDEVPLLDESGRQIMVTVPAKEAVYHPKTGELLRAASPEYQIPEMHRVKRMVRKPVTVQKLVEREGRRNHWGFDAMEVKAVFDAIGADFGGHVLSEDGTHHLRMDQFVPILWQAVKELKAEIDQLKAAGQPHVSP